MAERYGTSIVQASFRTTGAFENLDSRHALTAPPVDVVTSSGSSRRRASATAVPHAVRGVALDQLSHHSETGHRYPSATPRPSPRRGVGSPESVRGPLRGIPRSPPRGRVRDRTRQARGNPPLNRGTTPPPQCSGRFLGVVRHAAIA